MILEQQSTEERATIEPVLTDQDRQFFEENGYVRVEGAVPPENCQAVIDATWEFLEIDPANPEDWYRPPLPRGGMVEFYQHQALWDNRQSPRLYGAFRDLFGNEKLWVSFDRVNLKPPAHPDHPEYDHKGFIHWDVDTSKLPVHFGVQGVLYLCDTTEDQGGFQCVPGMHRNLEEWVKTQPPDRNPFVPDLTGRTVVPVPGKAGDLVIWNRLLPHGNGHNRSDRIRWAQFISMYPARQDDDNQRQYRIERWKWRLPPRGKPFPGDPREKEIREGKTAELTPLGRKLLGLDLW